MTPSLCPKYYPFSVCLIMGLAFLRHDQIVEDLIDDVLFHFARVEESHQIDPLQKSFDFDVLFGRIP
jgi:hypothetical protein